MNQFEYEATLRDYKEEGRDEARAEIARAMKAKGLSDDIIKDVTGVSPDAL